MIELHRLRDRHEVARHALVGDRHRAAERDLAAEDRHDRARTSRGRCRSARSRSVVLGQRCCAASTAHSASAFDAPMTVAGVTALSVETSTNAPDALLARDPRHQPRRERVVAHRLDRVELHQPDVLVGGGVEDDRRAVLGEHLAHPLALLAVGEHRRERRRVDVAVVLELALDLEEVVLGVVERGSSRRGATRAIWRHSSEPIEPPAPVTITTSPLRYAPTRSSSMRTGSRPRMSSTCTSRTWRTTLPAALQQLEDGRQRAHRDRRARGTRCTTRARSVPGADGIAIVTSSGSASSRIRAEVVGRAEHAHAVDALAALARVVVDEADRVQRRAPGCAGSRAARAGRRRRRRRSGRAARPCAARKPRSGRS